MLEDLPILLRVLETKMMSHPNLKANLLILIVYSFCVSQTAGEASGLPP
jgi:hypothetical protein